MEKSTDITKSVLSNLMAIGKKAALEAGNVVMDIYRTGSFDETAKEDASPLTIADKRSHAIIIRHLAQTGLPVQSEEGKNIPYSERKDWQYYWLIDPLDGTREFINRNGEFTINIALMHSNTPVAGIIYVPCLHTLYTGSKDTGVHKNENGLEVYLSGQPQRKTFSDLSQQQNITAVVSRSHLTDATRGFLKKFQHVTLILKGSSLKFMMLAENLAHIYPRLEPTMEWDTAAAHAILNACNRGVYNTDLEMELLYNKESQVNPPFIAF